MTGTTHGQPIGFSTRESPWAAKKATGELRRAFILTWHRGYDAALIEATEAESKGELPILLKLANQDSPSTDTWREIHSHKFPLLSVSGRFASKEAPDGELLLAVQKAILQWNAGRIGVRGRLALSPTPRVTQQGTTTELTEDERRELLQAVYGNEMDDGVR